MWVWVWVWVVPLKVQHIHSKPMLAIARYVSFHLCKLLSLLHVALVYWKATLLLVVVAQEEEGRWVGLVGV